MTEYTHADGAGSVHGRLRAHTQIDRQQVESARRAAEALFAPKRPAIESATPDPALSADRSPRKPRILSATEMQPPQLDKGKPFVGPEPIIPRQQIPTSHLARIRTWLKYGMTVRQAADVYGVSVDDIESVRQKV